MRAKLNYLAIGAGGIVLLLGAVLALGGLYLVTLGGSIIFALLGVLIGSVGYALLIRSSIALPLSVLFLGVDLIWAFTEAGNSFWQLFPRVVIPLVVVAITFALSPLLKPWKSYQAKTWLAAVGAGLPLAVVVVMIAQVFVPHAEVTASGEEAPVTDATAGDADGKDWGAWGRNLSGTKYAQFSQINRSNVKNLKVAWTYRTGELAVDGAEYQVTPLKIDDTMYLCTPLNKVIALDPSTGKEIWRFDPHVKITPANKGWMRCRGVSYFDTTKLPQSLSAVPASSDSDEASTSQAPVTNASSPGENSSVAGECAKRIVTTTIDGRMFELDAKTGKICESFGDHGYVNLLENLGPDAWKWWDLTSAPLVANGVVVVGGKINDNVTVGETSGVVRGFDALTGKILWAWDATRGANDSTPLPPGENYPTDTPNFWGTASYDPKLNLVYFPTGNQTPDFWTGNRSAASDEYTDSLVAVDLNTGREKWHFRMGNNDQFDYDVMSQPILYDLPNKDGSKTPVVIQLTKRGEIFVLDRRDGKPVVPVEYRKVPTDGMPGQRISPVQPFSALAVGTTPLSEKDMWGATLLDQLYCRISFKKLHWEGPWTPLLEKKNTLIWPGYYGGFNWGGGAIDPSTGTLIVNDIRMAMIGHFIKREEAAKEGLLPSTEGEYSVQNGTPWGVERGMFLSPLGAPCFKPPFGSLTAIDLATQKVKWQVPTGSIQDATMHGSLVDKIFGTKGVKPGMYVPIGMPTLGGPLVTKGGLTFFHGSLDYYVRAFDNQTGKEVWKDRLPVGGQGVPMTYLDKNDKQFVVVVDGGATRTGTNRDRGDYVIAYSLN